MKYRIISAAICIWLYLPHLLLFLCKTKVRKTICQDIKCNSPEGMKLISDSASYLINLVYLLHSSRYFRTLFYHRIGTPCDFLCRWYMPGDRYFIISRTTRIGGGMKISHPYATIINAEEIGKNFRCIQCTTLGKTDKGRPIVGDNVTLGANVTIIGNVKIGNNVIVGAGSIVVKDIPDNCIAVGNPCKPIRYLDKDSI